MKNKLIILMLTLGWLVLNGQVGQLCATYDQNRGISEMREILMKDGLYYQNLRASYAEVINYSIGKNIITNSKYGMEYILKNTVLLDVNFVIPSDYFNGVRFEDEIEFTTLTGQPSDKWAAFRYLGVDYIYAKVSCMNPQKPKKPGIFEEKNINPTEEKIKPILLPYDYGDSKKKEVINLNLSPIKEKKKGIKIGYIAIPITMIVASGVTYLLMDSPKDSGTPKDTGRQGIDPGPNSGD